LVIRNFNQPQKRTEMKKNLLLLAAGILVAAGTNAQGWVTQNTGFTVAKTGIRTISIVDANTVWVSTYGPGTANSHAFARTINGGTTWIADSVKTVPAMPKVNAFSNICAKGKDTAWACMYGDNTVSGGGIYHTTDGGITWALQSTAAFTLSSFPDFVYFFDKNNGVALGDPNPGFEIYTTSNGGTNWTAVPTGNIPATLAGEYGNANGFSVSGNTIWATTSAGRVLKSTDMGLHWTASVVGSISENISMLSFKDATHGLAVILGTSDSIMRTTDGGTTWALVPATGRFLHSGLCYAPGTPGMYVNTGAAATKKGTSFSLDDGATWMKEDTIAQHTAVAFLNTSTGWTGNFNTSATVGGIFKWTGDIMAIEENQSVNGISLYPNPNKGQFQIELKELSGKALQINIFDITGKVVYQSSEGNSNSVFMKNVDLSASPKGMYFVQIRDGDKMSTRKIVID
jgi:photosystem II stability/assembly factor-like uncharacterized protein